MATVTMVEAINAALRDSLADDEKVLVFGEDVGTLGGVFRVTDGLHKQFGPARCFDTPLAESGIMGIAVGLAARGFRPVPEIQFDGFLYPALDQLISHVAKYRNRSHGGLKMPITVRIPSFGGIGSPEHHGESPETYLVHTAGLRVISPSTPSDAYSMLREAIECDDPVMYLEPKRRYWSREDVEFPIRTEPMGKAIVRRPGTDVTLLAYGGMVATSLEAAEAANEEGWSVEVVDLRSLLPLDRDTIFESVVKTGRAVIVHEAPRTLGLGAEIAALIQEHCFYNLEAPVLRATGFDTPYPSARIENAWLPGVDRILDTIEQSFSHSDGR